MRIRYFETKRGRIELIPMIDVMFFLLVFFMILTLHMIPDQGLKMALPQSTTAKVLPKPKVLINLSRTGVIHVGDAVVSEAALEHLLVARGPVHPQVTIAAAKGVPFQDFIQVMDACRKAGVENIGIATRPSA
ncbi:MAG TPA: biopolymer transporter ExbD [Acidiferrobacter sp.]|nr:biopolymer transporter ExbD [Acidiferrobacter sp.]